LLAKTQTLSAELLCSNRDLPSHLETGRPDGDLTMDGLFTRTPIRLLRRPGKPCRFKTGNIEEWKAVIHEAENGLAKMVEKGYKFKGIVRRDADFTAEQIEKLFPKNGIFQDQAFLSSTRKIGGEFSGNTKIEIKSSRGVDVRSVSRHPTEEEVLFPPGTKFKVISRETDSKNGTFLIKIEEI